MWSDSKDFQSAGITQHLQKQIDEDRLRARKFAAAIRQLAIDVDERFETGDRSLVPEVTALLAQWNWLSWWMPSYFGGKGRHPITALAVLEEIGRECLGFANVLGAHFVGYSILSSTLNLPLISRISRDVCEGEKRGEARLITAALTEPTAGSDLEDHVLLARAERSSSAKRNPDGTYLLSGAKQFISNSAWAAWHVIVAPVVHSCCRWAKNSNETEKAKRQIESMIAVIPNDREGLSVGSPERKLGQHACPASSIQFDQVIVASEEVALDAWQFNHQAEFELFSKFLHEDVLAMSRPGVAAMAAGTMLRVFDELKNALGSQSSKQSAQLVLAQLAGDAMLSRQAAWNSMQRVYTQGPMAKMGSLQLEAFSSALPSSLRRTLGSVLVKFQPSSKARTKRLALRDERASEIRFGWGALTKAKHAQLAEQSAAKAILTLGPEAVLHAPVLFKILRDSKLLSIYEGTTSFNQLSLYSSWLAHPDIVGAEPFAEPLEEARWN